MIRPNEIGFGRGLPEEGLGTPWPSPAVKHAYALAHEEFVHRYQSLRKHGLRTTAARLRAFTDLCQACSTRDCSGTHWSSAFESGDLAAQIQSVASVLAILTHANPVSLQDIRATNGRRPQSRYGTYPNSPALCQEVARSVVGRLFERPDIVETVTSAAKGRIIDQVPLRILELSCEGGQLVAAVALEIVRQGKIPTDRVSSAARHVLSLLAERCLWAYDINPLATIATQCTFNLLAQNLAGRSLRLRHLRVQNSLLLSGAGLGKFDAVLNNPPWGEKLTIGERASIRTRFATTRFRPDTYIAFAELGISFLNPEGVFGLIIPSQFLAAHNAAGLREFLSSHTLLEHLVLLPRGEFAEATVRAAVLIGTHTPGRSDGSCRVTIFPFRYHLSHRGPARSRSLAYDRFISQGARSWWPLLADDGPTRILTRVFRLGDVAQLTSGIILSELESVGAPEYTFRESELFRGARGRDFRSMTTLIPRNITQFNGVSRRVIRHHALVDTPRVFVRELVRRDGQMCATVATPDILPLHGVLTVVCHKIRPAVAAALLNSTIVAEVNRRHLGGFSKVDFQRITLAELGEIPVASALCAETVIAKRIDALAQRALAADSQEKRAECLRQLDVLFQWVYLETSKP